VAAIRAHPVIVTLITLAAVGGSVGFLLTRSSDYEATGDLLLNPLPQEDEVFFGLPLIRDSGDPVRTAQTAASLVESRDAADQTAERLGADWTADDVLDAVEVAARGESDVLGVTAVAGDPDKAAEIANEFSGAALEVRAAAIAELAEPIIAQLDARLETLPLNDPARAELASRRDRLATVAREGDPTVLLAQEAIPPTSAIGAPPVVIAVLAALAGFVLGSGAAMLMELLARRVRDPEDAFALYPLPVLVRIPEVPSRRLRGPSDTTWYMPPEIREPFRTLALQVDQQTGASGSIMVTSPSSGDGKTTSAINLAVSLAAGGRDVILLDFDLRNPQVGPALGIEGRHTIADLLDPERRLDRLLFRAADLSSLRVLPILAASGEVGLIDAASTVLPQLVDEAKRLADHVVIDTAPLGEVGDALRLAGEVDQVLVLMRPGNTNRQQLQVLRDLLQGVGQDSAGYILLGRAEGASRGYYAYGYDSSKARADAAAQTDSVGELAEEDLEEGDSRPPLEEGPEVEPREKPRGEARSPFS